MCRNEATGAICADHLYANTLYEVHSVMSFFTDRLCFLSQQLKSSGGESSADAVMANGTGSPR